MRRRAALLAGFGLAWVTLVSAQPSPVTGLLERYSAGQFDESIAAGATLDIRVLRRGLTGEAARWIGSGPDAGRRQAAVAAFALEVTERRLDTEFLQLVDVVEAVCGRLRASPERSRFELAWFQASMALAGRARAAGWLLAAQARSTLLPARLSRVSERDPGSMHIAHAIARFPDQSSFELDRIVAWTWTRDEERDRNGSVRRPGRLNQTTQARMLDSAIGGLRTLADDPIVGGEALMREGQLQLVMGRNDQALLAFERSLSRSALPQVRFLSRYLAGRALVAEQRSDEAMRSFADALVIIPRADSAAIALASLQLQRGESQHVAATLQPPFEAPNHHPDPGRLVGYGSYMYWPELRAAMRAEIRP